MAFLIIHRFLRDPTERYTCKQSYIINPQIRWYLENIQGAEYALPCEDNVRVLHNHGFGLGSTERYPFLVPTLWRASAVDPQSTGRGSDTQRFLTLSFLYSTIFWGSAQMLSDTSSARPTAACHTDSFSRTVRLTKTAGSFLYWATSNWCYRPFTCTEGHFISEAYHIPQLPASRACRSSHDAAEHAKLNKRLAQPIPASKYSGKRKPARTHPTASVHKHAVQTTRFGPIKQPSTPFSTGHGRSQVQPVCAWYEPAS